MGNSHASAAHQQGITTSVGGSWHWIFAHLQPFRFFMILYLLGCILGQGLLSSVPRVSGLAIDAMLQRPPLFTHFLWLILLLLLIVVLRGLLSVSANYSLERTANGFERNVRDELYHSLLDKPQAFFNRHRAGDLMVRATDDTKQLNQMFAPGLEIFQGTVLGFLVPLIFIAQLNISLLLAPAIFVLFFIITVRGYGRRLKAISDEVRHQNGLMTTELTEAIAGFEIIEVMGQKEHARRRFDEEARLLRDRYVRQGQVQALYFPPLLLALIIAIAFVHGILLVNQHVLTIGGFVAYLSLVSMLRTPTSSISYSIVLLQNGLSSARRILVILKEESSQDNTSERYKGNLQGELVFDHVSFSYKGVPILTDVSFHVAAGQTLALVGPTGAGKTMITRLVNRMYDSDNGSILIDGVDVRDWDLDALRSQIGIIEQDVVLFSRSVSDNIAFGVGKQCSQEQIEEAARLAQADTFIRNFQNGYNTIVGERGITLSGGQRQRIAIARALLTNPRLLILDDSTSAIDSATEAEIQRAIRSIATHRTTLLITHRLSQIRQADTILVLDQGKVVAQGTHDELIAHCGLYQRIFAPYYQQGGVHVEAASDTVLSQTTAPGSDALSSHIVDKLG